jgi:hypothetical protein
VCKLSIARNETAETYLRDIEMQARCAHYADLYNQVRNHR